MDSRICQTFTVSPAEPGDYPLYLFVALAAPMVETEPHDSDGSERSRRCRDRQACAVSLNVV